MTNDKNANTSLKAYAWPAEHRHWITLSDEAQRPKKSLQLYLGSGEPKVIPISTKQQATEGGSLFNPEHLKGDF